MELIGVEPAHHYVVEALERGKQVVTANKELMARHGHAILAEAARHRRDVYFEAAVAGGIPLIRPLKVDLAGNRIARISGILNGTTNYILTRMAAEGKEFSVALREAQELGYAEADPTYDVEGLDAAYKIDILAAIALQTPVDVTRVYHEGITRISPRDIAHARELGYVIKLLATARDEGSAIDVRVHPALVPQNHPLASVNDAFNAVLLNGDAVGDVMFYGRGAGSLPTGSAVVGDLIDVARNIRFGATGRVPCVCNRNKPMRDIAELSTENYMRMLVKDQPGLIAGIGGIRGEPGASTWAQKGTQGDLAEIVGSPTRRRSRVSAARSLALPSSPWSTRSATSSASNGERRCGRAEPQLRAQWLHRQCGLVRAAGSRATARQPAVPYISSDRWYFPCGEVLSKSIVPSCRSPSAPRW